MALAETENDERKEYFSAYTEYNKILRTWFVTFGVGGPLLLLANSVTPRCCKNGAGR